MTRQHLTLAGVAAAALAVGLVIGGAPLGTLLTVGLVLACPLMMVFMMRGMRGGGSHGGGGDSRDVDASTRRAGSADDEPGQHP